MYGTNGSIGLLVPSCNTVVEHEYNMALPPGYLAIAARMWMQGGGIGALQNMLHDVEHPCEELATAHVDAAVFACTSASFMNGTQGESALQSTIADHAHCQPVTTSSAFVEALKKLGASRVAVATPYIPELNELERQYLALNGFAVTDIRGMVTPGYEQIDPYGSGRVNREDVLAFVLDIDYGGADAIVISCTNFPTFEIIDEVESRAGLPVVTSNQATLWKALRTVGFGGVINGFGELLRSGFSDVGSLP